MLHFTLTLALVAIVLVVFFGLLVFILNGAEK